MCTNENVFTSKTSRFQIRQEIHQHLQPSSMPLPLSLIAPSQVANNSAMALPSSNSHVNTETSLIQPSSTICSESATTTLTTGLLSLDQYRFHLYNYAMSERIRCAQYSQQLPSIATNYPASAAAAAAAAAIVPYGPRLALSMSLFHNRIFQPEEPKPQHSYIGLIAIAILSAPECKLVLSDIYQYILDNYPYFRTRGPGWRNSIRHNLSLNDCFIKSGRSANGKGHYWAIHPANQDDFKKGDFRRRKAQRKVRRHMGLAVDDDGTDSSSPPSLSPPTLPNALQSLPWGMAGALDNHVILPQALAPPCISSANKGTIKSIMGTAMASSSQHRYHNSICETKAYTSLHIPYQTFTTPTNTKKRQFDVASLLAPDNNDVITETNVPIFLNKKRIFNPSLVNKGGYTSAREPKFEEHEKIDQMAEVTTATILETHSTENSIGNWRLKSSSFGVSIIKNGKHSDDISDEDEDYNEQNDDMEIDVAETSSVKGNNGLTTASLDDDNNNSDNDKNNRFANKDDENRDDNENSNDNNNNNNIINNHDDNSNNPNISSDSSKSSKNDHGYPPDDDRNNFNKVNTNTNNNNNVNINSSITSSNCSIGSNASISKDVKNNDGVQNILKIYDIRGINFVNNIDVYEEMSDNCILRDMNLSTNNEANNISKSKQDSNNFNGDVNNDKNYGIDMLTYK